MKKQILKLRSQGKSYNQIQKILNCSKSTISYHCGDGQKEKAKQRLHSYVSKNLNGILKRKKDNFSFVTRKKKLKKRVNLNFSAEEFKNKLISNPECYLTGRKIDLLRPKTYQCDHIIPLSQGGNCELSNMGLTCKEANLAKHNLSHEDFINLCKEILIHHGYKVINQYE
jgi:5-methylcytosine-specific restriction endonuclease McrA